MWRKKYEAYNTNKKYNHGTGNQKRQIVHQSLTSDVNKDLGLKAKAKAKDSDPKAKAKAKDLSHKAKAKAKDSDPKAKDKAKDLGPKAKAKDSRYQGPIFHRSSPYIICSSLTLCACFYVRTLHFVSLWINGYVFAVNDNWQRRMLNSKHPKDDNYHKT